MFAAAILLTFITASPPAHHPVHKAPADLLARIAKSNPASLAFDAPPTRPLKTNGLRITPATHGADPTGTQDSWAALTACIAQCVNQSKNSPNGFFPGQDTSPTFGPIRDAGGCWVDLDGGEYRISKPLMLPEMVANMQFGGGSIVASPDFDAGKDPAFLFVIGVQGSCKVPQGSCNIDINFPELFIDGGKVASGMQINNVMGVTIGPGGYFLNFTAYGVQINNGHEVMMERTWMGETNFDFDHEKLDAPPNATAIQINGNDHYILNTIIFSSKIGVEVNGAADYITGVHVWFPVNHAVHFPDTKAFHITGGGNRFSGCYIDGGRAIFNGNSALKRNIWTLGFECCQNGPAIAGTTSSGITLIGTEIGPGLQIVNNEFGGGTIFHRATMWPGMLDRNDVVTSSAVHDNCNEKLNVSADDLACIDLDRASAAGDKSLAMCEAECCAKADCTVAQWCAAGDSQSRCDGVSGKDAECWIGKYSKCIGHGKRIGWQGRGNDGGSAPGPTPSGPVKMSGTRIEHNSEGKVGTKVTQSLTQTAATMWNFNFCDELLIPQIAIARVHVSAATGFPTAVARPTTDCNLVVETSVPVTGTVTVDVDSSEPSAGFI